MLAANVKAVIVSTDLDGSKGSMMKRQAILDAATDLFLQNGYLGTNMDEIAVRAGVSKQTVYNHFSEKEALFIEIVTRMTNAGSDAVQNEGRGLEDGGDVAEYLRRYAYQQLKVVLTPRLMQLRRVVIGEVNRFPELGKYLYEGGPERAMAALAEIFSELGDRGLLTIDDPAAAASQFNWLIMSEPLNRVMLLGDDAIPTQSALRRHAEEGVRVFLAAYKRT
jgi:TetR/AcrR family transcriptional regulator, mexJK operon transcriptional repressor